MDLTTLTTPKRVDEHRYTSEVFDGWQQGKGAFGGLVIATMVRAMQSENTDADRPLRVLTAEIFGPVMVGACEIEARALRVGNGVTTIEASLSQAGAPLAHAIGIFGKKREGKTHSLSPAAPSGPAWRDVPEAPVAPPLAPTFSQHFEFRVTGALPFSGGTDASAQGFIRARRPGAARDAATIAALADAWWPSALALEAGPRPMSTIAFTLEIVSSLDGLDPEAPLLHRARTVAGSDGYLVDFRELWGDDGRLVALNQQTFVVVK